MRAALPRVPSMAEARVAGVGLALARGVVIRHESRARARTIGRAALGRVARSTKARAIGGGLALARGVVICRERLAGAGAVIAATLRCIR